MIQTRHRLTHCTRFVLSTAFLAATIGMAAPALAQQSNDSAGVIEEIVVTARLREESAQDIGQSIRAIAQDEIERAGIVDFGDIARRTAGLDFTYRGPNANEVSIRGVAKIVNQGTLAGQADLLQVIALNDGFACFIAQTLHFVLVVQHRTHLLDDFFRFEEIHQ